MDSSCFEALLIPLGEGVSLRLEEEATSPGISCDPLQLVYGLPDGSQAVPSRRRLDAASPGDRPPLLLDPTAPDRGLSALRLFELRDYYWELTYSASKPRPTVALTSSLANSSDHDLWKAHGSHGRFRFVNYLGSAWIEAAVAGLAPVRVAFEVASPKLDYEQEYRAMVEAIGAECQQLLLEWGTPTSLSVVADPAKQHQTLLEQFLFLRHVLGTERLDLYLETIGRRPHSRLERELDWKPAGSSDPALFLTNPLRYGRDWRCTEAGLLPAEIQEERKFDSLDTPPNRFLKFALQSFRSLCEAILTAERGGRRAFAPDDAVTLEASSMLRSLDTFIALPLFEGVGNLRRIPFDSTTLQRREGYRELLLAWLMLDAAAQLDWPGREDAYDGTTRDVATLYEFWLYFVLVRAFREQLGMTPEEDPLAKVGAALPFCCRPDDGRLVINLQQGKESYCRFTWEHRGRKLLLHFFYNRSFSRRGVTQRGTYSKQFRPDYTLVILPEEFASTNWYDAEQRAEAAGRIAYLHFDAKYRIENLAGVIGEPDTEPLEVEADSVSPEGAQQQREAGREKASGTAKNADLYKMHTYNDAIRRTIGSYVLYPGDDPADKVGANRFQRYHEIIPGIGAFALRPVSNNQLPAGLSPLCDFIRDVLVHQMDRFTQHYRVNFWTHNTVSEPPAKYQDFARQAPADGTPPADAPVAVGFIRAEAQAACRARSLFYFHAVEADGSPTPFDQTVLQARLFVPYGRDGWLGWHAKIKSCQLIQPAHLKARLAEDAHVVGEAQLYYLMELNPKSIKDFAIIPPSPAPRTGPPQLRKWTELFPLPKPPSPPADNEP